MQPNKIQKMSKRQQENIKVVVRFRPLNAREKTEKVNFKLNFAIKSESSLLVETDNVYICSQPNFAFDRVFDSKTSQEDFYEYSCKPVIAEVLKGYNGTIFAYGQTGAGKTYSMMGNMDSEDLVGVIPRASRDIFDSIRNAKEQAEYRISCSYLEIYNERLMDLLDPSPLEKKRDLKILESPQKGVYIEGLSEEYVSSEEEIYEILRFGSNNRQVSGTKMNQESSRSHTVFIVKVIRTLGDGTTTTGKFNLVDLAGSEKVAKTEAEGQQLEEAKKINQSLTTLGQCINSLVEQKSHVPFRDSKLTRVLQESLGGNSKTTMICAASLSPYNAEETISTLRFGQRAKNIKCKVKLNSIKSAAELQKIVEKLEQQISILSQKNKNLSELLGKYTQIPTNLLAGVAQDDVEKDEGDRADTQEVEENDYSAQKFIELQVQLEELQAKCKEEASSLKDEIRDLQSENNELKNTIKKLKDKNEKLEEDEETVKDQLQKLTKQQEDIQNHNQFKVNELLLEVKTLKQNVIEEEKKRLEISKELENVKEEAKFNAAQLVDMAQNITDSEARAKTIFAIESLTESNKLYRSLNAQQKERIYDLECKYSDEKLKTAEVEAELGSSEEFNSREIKRLEKENKKFSQKVKKLEKETQELDDECADLDNEINKAFGELDASDDLVDELKDKIKKLEKESLQKDEDIVLLKAKVEKVELIKKGSTTIEAELEDFVLDEYTEKVKHVKSAASVSETKKDKLILQLKADLKEEQKNVKSIEKELTRKIERLEDDLDEAKDKYDDLDVEMKELEEETDKLKDKIKSLKKEVEALQQLQDDREDAFKKVVVDFEEHIKIKDKDLEQVMIQKENLKQQVSELQERSTSTPLGNSQSAGKLGRNWANELFELKNRLQKTEDMRDKLEKEANYSRQQIQSERSKLQAAIQKIELQNTRIAELQRELETVRMHSGINNEEKERRRKKKQMLLDEIESLKRALTAAEQLSQQTNARKRSVSIFKPIKSGNVASGQ